jgi:hypothetical protein
MDDKPAEYVRYLTTASLLGAAYVSFTCPCPVICECKLGLWYGLVLTPAVLIFFHNASKSPVPS